MVPPAKDFFAQSDRGQLRRRWRAGTSVYGAPSKRQGDSTTRGSPCPRSSASNGGGSACRSSSPREDRAPARGTGWRRNERVGEQYALARHAVEVRRVDQRVRRRPTFHGVVGTRVSPPVIGEGKQDVRSSHVGLQQGTAIEAAVVWPWLPRYKPGCLPQMRAVHTARETRYARIGARGVRATSRAVARAGAVRYHAL